MRGGSADEPGGWTVATKLVSAAINESVMAQAARASALAGVEAANSQLAAASARQAAADKQVGLALQAHPFVRMPDGSTYESDKSGAVVVATPEDATAVSYDDGTTAPADQGGAAAVPSGPAPVGSTASAP